MRRSLVISAVLALAAIGCDGNTVEPTVSFIDGGCTSSNPDEWPSGPLEIQVSNNTDNGSAVVMGTYSDGFGHEDLVAYGSDVTNRPDFIDALEIFEAEPSSTSSLSFDHGPGTYFMVCMPDNDTMVVLDDLTRDG